MAAETHFAARRGLPPPASVVRRKSEAYQYMNAILRDPLLQRSEEAVHAVIAALIIESRIAGPEVTRIHLQGLERLIRVRGGLTSLLNSPLALMNMSLYMRVLHLGLTETADRRHLELVADRFISLIKAIQCWKKDMRAQLARLASQPPKIVHSASRDPTYFLIRHTVFASPALRHILSPTFPSTTPAQMTDHFSFLFGLNLTLFDLRDNDEASTAFLQHVLTLVTGSGTIDATTGHSSLKIDALPWLLTKVRFDISARFVEYCGSGSCSSGSSSCSSSRAALDIWRSEATIDALQMEKHMSAESRQTVMAAMSTWLLDPYCRWAVNDSDLLRLKIEVISRYRLRHPT